jgi:hypothetical protein
MRIVGYVVGAVPLLLANLIVIALGWRELEEIGPPPT